MHIHFFMKPFRLSRHSVFGITIEDPILCDPEPRNEVEDLAELCGTFCRRFPQRWIKLSATFSFVLTLFVLSCCLTAAADEPTQDEIITFDDHIGPLLRNRCSTCHNPTKKSGDLDVTHLSSLLEGGGSGSGIEPGDAGSSYLFSLISYEDSPNMPPSGKIPDAEIALVKRWIEGGALENKSSKATLKPKFEMAMSAAPTTRPEVLPLPARMPLEPALRTERASAVTAMAASPWAPIVAIAAPHQVLLYNTQSLQLVGVLPTTGQADSLRFSRNGSVLIAGGGINGARGNVTLWNVLAGEEIAQIGDELDAVLAADISPDQTLIALGGPQKLVKVFSTADGSLRYELKKHTDWVTAIEFSPDGKFLASGDRNGGVQLWYAEDGSEHLTLKAHTGMISDLSWRIDGKVIATASEDTSIRLWEVENGNQIKAWNSHAPGVTSIEFGLDGTLFTCGRDHLGRKWNQDGSQLAQYEGLTDVAVEATYCNESKRVMVGDWTGIVRVWNDAEAASVGTLDPNPPTLAERLSLAQSEVQQRQQQLAPLADAVTESTKQLAELSGSLQQAQQQQQTVQSKLAQLESQLATAHKQFASTVAEQDRWRHELAENIEAKPLIQEAFTKALEAAKALPSDAELQTTADTLGEKTKQVFARVDELNTLVTQSDQKKAATGQLIEQLTAAIDQTRPELETAATQITELESQIGTMNDQLAQQRQALDAVEQTVQQSLANVQRWQSEIDFIAQLDAIRNELQAAREAYAAKEAAAEEAAEKLAQLEEQATFARSVQSEAQQQVEALNQKMRELKGIDK